MGLPRPVKGNVPPSHSPPKPNLHTPSFLPQLPQTNKPPSTSPTSLPQFSPARNRVSLSLRCRWGITHGLFYVARDPAHPSKILGTAMWLPPRPPSQPQSWSLYLSSWTLWLAQLRMNLWYGRGGLSTARYWVWKASQAAAQAELWTSDRGYYFCNIVTVLPEAQGRGVGRALMEVVLERADREGVYCYLESSRKDPNVKIYERFGFRLVREMECKEGEEESGRIMLFCMIREPGVTRVGEQQGGDGGRKSVDQLVEGRMEAL